MIVGKLDNLPHCPKCGMEADGFGGQPAAIRPAPGDRCICMYCEAPLEYTETLDLAPLDIDALDDDDLAGVQGMIRMVHGFNEYRRKLN